MNKRTTEWAKAKDDRTKRFDKKDESSENYDFDYRNKFQKDKDRILYSRAFRRLKGKTQIFLAGFDDHIRDRLTHTLEVSQLAKTISIHLGLDVDLTEAIALGHDIGHTPFGHVGERVLNKIMNGEIQIKDFKVKNQKGFKHNWQSLRVLEEIERDEGLNLTNYTLWGILTHSSLKMRGYNNIPEFYNHKYGELIKYGEEYWTIEALIVRISDEIAQRHHDIEDGLFTKTITKDEVLKLFIETFKDDTSNIDKNNILIKINSILKKKEYKTINMNNLFIPNLKDINRSNDSIIIDINLLLSEIKHETDKTIYTPMITNLIIRYYILNYINHFKKKLENLKPKKDEPSFRDIKNIYNDYVKPLLDKDKDNINYHFFHFDKDFSKMDEKFQTFLMNKILNSHTVQVMDGQGSYIIKKLFEAYVTNPLQLPDNGILSIYKNILKFNKTEEEKSIIKKIKQIKRKDVGKLRNILRKFHDNLNKIQENDKKDIKKENIKFKINNEIPVDENLTFNEFHNILFRTIADYIGGMTDEFTTNEFQKLYGIKMF